MKVYKLKETSEPGAVIVVIEGKISESEHRVLSSLPGDLFLIFPESVTKEIDVRKFSNLYEATWYGVYKGDKVFGVWGALDYLESLSGYFSVSVVLVKYFLGEDDFKSLRRLQYSGIETSVFSRQELTKAEKEQIYLIKPRLLEIAFGYRIKIPGSQNTSGMYSKYVTKDPIVFLRPSSIRGIRESCTPEILKSFVSRGPAEFISSLIPEDTYINVKINEAKI